MTSSSNRFSPRQGLHVGPWRLEARLGSGAFGDAWTVRGRSGEEAVLKLLSAPPGDELRALGGLCHPGVPALLDAGVTPAPYLVMARAPGRPLGTMVRKAAAPPEPATRVAAALLDALAACHAAGVVHGDIKPDNVVVGSAARGEVSLVDFGMVGQAGGTLRYAAPERLQGGRPTPAADVYAVGLCWWEMLHRSLPGDADEDGLFVHRGRPAPEPAAGLAPWAARLLRALLHPDPQRRPTAARAADIAAANGVALLQPGPGLLRQRAARAWLPRPELTAAVEAWLSGGTAHLGITGPAGSGRTRALRRLHRELQARGALVLWIDAGGAPWEPVSAALGSPGLPGEPAELPAEPDPAARAWQAAEALVARAAGQRLWVVADDLDALDEGTRRTVAALTRLEGASTCTARGRAIPGARAVGLAPLAPPAAAALCEAVLGKVDGVELLARWAVGLSDGWPAGIVAAALEAVAREAVAWRGRRMVVDPVGLAGIDVLPDAAPAPPLDPAAARVAASLELWSRPGDPALLAELADLPAEGVPPALAALEAEDLVSREGDAWRLAGAGARSRLRGLAVDRGPLAARAARALLARRGSRDRRLPRLLALAEDADLLAAHGERALALCRVADPRQALELAEAGWRLTGHPWWSAARVEACIAAGEPGRARQAAEERIQGSDDPDEVIAHRSLLAWACLQQDDAEAAAAALPVEAPPAADPRALAAAVIRCRVQLRLKRHEAVIHGVEAILEAGPRRSAPELLDLEAQRAEARAALGRAGEALTRLDAVLAGAHAPSASLARLHGVRGRLRWMKADFAGSAADFAAADALGTLPAVERARLLNNSGLALYQSGERQEAVSAWERALLLFERLEAPVEQIRLWINLCVAWRESGHAERARQVGWRAVDGCRQRGLPELEATALGNLGDVAVDEGDLEAAERCFTRADALVEAHGLDGERVELARRRAELAVRAGRDDADAAISEALRLSRHAGATLETARLHALWALQCGRRGDRAGAEAAVETALSRLREAGAGADLAVARAWVAEAWLALGEVDHAEATIERALAWAREMEQVPLALRLRTLSEAVEARRQARPEDGTLDRLLRLAVSVARVTELDAMLDALAEAAMQLLESDRSFVILHAEGGWEVGACRLASGAEPGPEDAPSRSIVERVLRERREVIAADLGERGDLRAARSVAALRLRSAMCVPMIDHDTLVGAIYVDSCAASVQALNLSARFMRALAAHGAVAVSHSRHLEAVARRADEAAELAHDLKSPVASMSAVATGLLERGDLPAEVRRELESVVALGRRALNMAGGLLDERRPRRDRALELNGLVGEVVDGLRPQARARGVALDLEAGPPAPVRGSAGELERVFANLVGNALKYTDTGGVVRVALGEDGEGVAIAIRDEGPGVPPDQLDTIFARGAQARGARAGHGLGLHVVSRFVAAHGGRVGVRTHPEGGAEFTVWLPAAGAACAAAR